MKIAGSLTELIGNTPLLRLKNIERETGANAEIIAKLESFNPLSSAKDRIGAEIIADAERKGLLKPGGTIIEATSGNTGIGLAAAAASKGYSLIITMPENMSKERVLLLKALGATVILTPKAEGMTGSVKKAAEIQKETPGSFIAGQFVNPANAEAHKKTTALEILRDTEGKTDVFVAGVGTGGTITGVGQVLKENIPGVKIVAVEPADSPLLSEGKAGPHLIAGMGANFIPEILDTSIYDEVITATTDEAFKMARLAAKKEGIPIGISSGAALSAAVKLAKRPENSGKRIVVLLCDSGERYLSTELFSE